MASLTGTKIKDTYDALLKVSDNGALDGTLQTITDGLGNNSALSLSTAGASVGGTLAVSGNTSINSGVLNLGTDAVASSLNCIGDVFTIGVDSDATSGGAPNMRFAVSAVEKMRISSSGDISFRDSSANEAFYWDASAASLGIGTTPLAKLEVKQSNSLDYRGLLVVDSATPNWIGLAHTGSAGVISVLYDGAGSSTPMVFKTADTERMRIDSSGNVGIGTASLNASSKLTISNSTSTSLYWKATSTNAGARDWCLITNNANFGDFAIRQGNSQGADATTGTNRLLIDASGNVGIGTSVPQFSLALKQDSKVGWNDAGSAKRGSITVNSSADAMVFATGTSDTERMRIDSSGNVQVRSGNQLQIYRSDNARYVSLYNDNSAVVIASSLDPMKISSPERLEFLTAGTERMRITSGGDVLIGATGTSWTNTVGFYSFYQSATNITRADAESMNLNRLTSDGDVLTFRKDGVSVGSVSVTGSSTAYNTSSDYRLKEDWVAMEGALDRVDALKPINFAWKSSGKRVDGFLAHELAEVVPEAVTGEKDATEIRSVEVSPAVYEEVIHPAEEAILDEEGNVIQEAKEEWVEKVLVSEAVYEDQEFPVYQGIDQSKVVPLLAAGLQEAHALIKELRAELNALKQA